MLQFENVTRQYHTADGVVTALDALDLVVEEGAFAVVKGPSGCGKSTLLLHAGGMLRPSSGKVMVAGQDLYALDAARRGAFRRDNIGFIFQMFHLLPYLNIHENIALGAPQLRSEVDGLIDRLGLAERRHHKPGALSAGEKQRAAIARALLRRPKLVLADEPTGNLDPDNAARVMQYLHEYQQAGGTVVVVTHGDDADAYATQSVRLVRGALQVAQGA